MTSEQWRRVPGFDQYEVSDLGNVRSWMPTNRHAATPHPRRLSLCDTGYLFVVIRKLETPGRTYKRKVHRLVGEAFLGPKPKGMVTRHLNGDKTDNRLSNLTYGTYAQNWQDSVDHGIRSPKNRRAAA